MTRDDVFTTLDEVFKNPELFAHLDVNRCATCKYDTPEEAMRCIKCVRGDDQYQEKRGEKAPE